MDLEKLKETLKANGVEEEKIDKILADLVEEEPVDDKDVDEPQADGQEPKGDLPPATTDEVVPTDTPVVEEVVTPKEEGETPQDDDIPPVPPTDEDVVPTDVPPTDVPPTEDVVPAVPQFDPTELIGKLDAQEGLINEQNKTIEGLVARIQSLEDALQKSGVLEKADEENVGIDETRVPDSGSIDAHSPMSSALAKLNGNKHF